MTTLEASLSVLCLCLLCFAVAQHWRILWILKAWRQTGEAWHDTCQGWNRAYNDLKERYTRLLHRRTDDGSEADWWKEQE